MDRASHGAGGWRRWRACGVRTDRQGLRVGAVQECDSARDEAKVRRRRVTFGVGKLIPWQSPLDGNSARDVGFAV